MELHKIGVKCFAEERDELELLDFIPVFHRWIQTGALDDLLIDVADYSHMHHGPGILLVAHEGNYGYDETGGRNGLIYYSKRELEGDSGERFAKVTRKALRACRLLEQEPELQGRVAFRGDELLVFSNDRLIAPNTEEAYARFEPALRAFLDRLYAGTGYELTRETDPSERLSITVKATEPVGVDTLLERLG